MTENTEKEKSHFITNVNTEPEPTVEPEVATNGTEVAAESSGDEDETAR